MILKRKKKWLGIKGLQSVTFDIRKSRFLSNKLAVAVPISPSFHKSSIQTKTCWWLPLLEFIQGGSRGKDGGLRTKSVKWRGETTVISTELLKASKYTGTQSHKLWTWRNLTFQAEQKFHQRVPILTTNKEEEWWLPIKDLPCSLYSENN